MKSSLEEIEQAIFNPTRKFFVHSSLIVFLIILLVFVGLAVHTPKYVTDAKMRHAYFKSMAMVLPMVVTEMAVIYFFVWKCMERQRKRIVPFVLEILRTPSHGLEVVTVKRVSRWHSFLSGRSMRRAIKQDLKRERVECCIQTDKEFSGVLIYLPYRVKGFLFFQKSIALPLGLVSAYRAEHKT
jgi:hypothetical protein